MSLPADAALADVAGVGPFFAVEVRPDVAGDPGWRPFTALCESALPGEIADVRSRLGVEETRVAASLLFQGVAGRLWSPVLATAALHRTVPDLSPGRLYWRAGSPIRLAVAEAAGRPAEAAAEVVLDRHLGPLAAAVRQVTPVAEGLLWGNAASALAGALTVLAGRRPAAAESARHHVERLLGTPPLRGTGTLEPRGFRRNSCCLYYRVPGGGLCGDCALR